MTTKKQTKKRTTIPQFRRPDTLLKAFIQKRIDHNEFLKQQRRLHPLGDDSPVPESEVKPQARRAGRKTRKQS